MFKKRTLLERLQKLNPYLEDLPETIYVDGAEISLNDATLDQIVLAIVDLEDRIQPINRHIYRLRDLVDMARKRQGLGAQRLDEIFSDEEARS
ncbi:MAG: hypothetical protein D6720_06040 [Gammaproteobacteria bacterium]|nr:MAG: hypothetical protein D6720_06040 [Gammaproteobacteria bacterium]